MPSVAIKADDEDADLFFAEGNISILVADARLKLKEFSEGEFQCCVTSPPYWGLRDYDHPDQIGAEPKLNEYVADLVSVFRELRRTLRDDGTLWLNIGDA